MKNKESPFQNRNFLIHHPNQYVHPIWYVKPVQSIQLSFTQNPIQYVYTFQYENPCVPVPESNLLVHHHNQYVTSFQNQQISITICQPFQYELISDTICQPLPVWIYQYLPVCHSITVWNVRLIDMKHYQRNTIDWTLLIIPWNGPESTLVYALMLPRLPFDWSNLLFSSH
jgi:hypothetical protein